MEQIAGIEPVPSAWEAEVLPLNYICRGKGRRRNAVLAKAISLCFLIFSKAVSSLIALINLITQTIYLTGHLKPMQKVHQFKIDNLIVVAFATTSTKKIIKLLFLFLKALVV